ncbi:Zinc finger and BTB domain-containing protein 24 [Orchesella cincta]|uniref:Zinc finger and BTB domain-containing protein 24 n=1 Tax=Orchesella cincta TaxID=48709 RepID=A0A1D2N217_ORCCI|nr:Zinc finger and BTB domain-containing protein 24 [Orchesella cincta]
MHIQRDHVKAKNFFCDQCGAGYALDCQLKNHIASVHTEATPVTCHVCGFVVSNKRFIKKHMKAASEALKMSTDEVEAYEHEEVTDKYNVQFVEKVSYSRACSVKRHYETVHEKKTVICQYCNKEIATSSLYQHQSQTKLCGAKRKAELEAKSNSTVVVVKQSTPSSTITAESEINAPFFDPFRDNHQQFENLNQSKELKFAVLVTTMVFCLVSQSSWAFPAEVSPNAKKDPVSTAPFYVESHLPNGQKQITYVDKDGVVLGDTRWGGCGYKGMCG